MARSVARHVATHLCFGDDLAWPDSGGGHASDSPVRDLGPVWDLPHNGDLRPCLHLRDLIGSSLEKRFLGVCHVRWDLECAFS